LREQGAQQKTGKNGPFISAVPRKWFEAMIQRNRALVKEKIPGSPGRRGVATRFVQAGTSGNRLRGREKTGSPFGDGNGPE